MILIADGGAGFYRFPALGHAEGERWQVGHAIRQMDCSRHPPPPFGAGAEQFRNQFQARRHDLGGLARTQFVAMVNHVEPDTHRCDKIRHCFDASRSVLGETPLRVLRFAFCRTAPCCTK
jgi:hypothetical protein